MKRTPRMRRRPWYTFGDVAVQPTRHGPIIVDAADLPLVEALSWHVREGKIRYVRAWLDSRRGGGDFTYLHLLLMRPSAGEVVDFKNGNCLDCRRVNLRIGDKTDDCCNRHVTHSSSGFLGVDYDKSRGKWRAQIGYRGKNIFLGRFDDVDSAVAARDEAASRIHGEFASTINAERRDKAGEGASR